jgi:hypothetical protein
VPFTSASTVPAARLFSTITVTTEATGSRSTSWYRGASEVPAVRFAPLSAKKSLTGYTVNYPASR